MHIRFHRFHTKKEKKDTGGTPAPVRTQQKLPGQPALKEKFSRFGTKVKSGFKKRHFRLWQKIWFALSLLCLLITVILGSYRSHVTAPLTDQNVSKRWETDTSRAAQVSCFFRDSGMINEESVRELNYNISRGLTNASIQAPSEDANLFIWCASGTGSTTLSYKKNQSSVTAIGVLGDFFDFHLFHYLSGGPFVTDSGMRDQIIIDEYTAWKLFGSSNVVGQTVDIGGVNHLISGVIQRPSGRFVKEAGITDDSSICIMSYKSLLQYTSAQALPSQNGTENQNINEGTTGGESQDSGGGSQNVGLSEILGGVLTVNVQAADTGTDVSSEGAGTAQEAGTTQEAGTADTSSTQAEMGRTSTESSAQESGSADTASTAESSETQAPAAASTQENTLPEGTGTQNTNYTDTGRINCYEAVMPEPVNGFAGGIVRQQAGNSSDIAVVVNSSRFSTLSLLEDLRGFASRSMETSGYTLPYWENIARGWESVLSLVVLLQLILTAVPVLYVLVMIIWYFRHRTWTAGNVFAKIRDRIYERQSEKRYGKGKKAPGLSSLTDESEKPEEIPDFSGSNEKEDR